MHSAHLDDKKINTGIGGLIPRYFACRKINDNKLGNYLLLYVIYFYDQYLENFSLNTLQEVVAISSESWSSSLDLDTHGSVGIFYSFYPNLRIRIILGQVSDSGY